MKTKNEWDENGDHLVLFMDIMGFKDRVTYPHNVLLKSMIEFKEKNDRLKPLLQDVGGELLRMVQFSDSIIIASMNSDKMSLNRIVKAGVVLMRNALESGFAIKGAIAKGSLTFDSGSGIFFGLPLVDAYLLEEEIKFYGIVFHHTVEELIEKSIQYPPTRGGKKIILPVNETKTPLKSGKSNHYCVCYHHLKNDLSRGDSSLQITNYLKTFSHTVSGGPRIYIDNTLDFITDNPYVSDKV